MRGKVLQYNGNDGKGIVTSEGKQYPFIISVWRSDVAPSVNAVVDISLDGDAVTSMSVVPNEILVKEKAAELAGNLGSNLEVVGGVIGAKSSEVGKSIVAAIGMPVIIGYAAFLLGSVALAFVNIKFIGEQSVTLFNLSDGLSQMGVGSGAKFLLFVAYLSLLIPVVWRDRKAWLALIVPALVLVKGWWDVHSALSAASSQMGALFGGTMAQEMSRSMSQAMGFGAGFYVCVGAALFLTGTGIAKYLKTATQS